MGFLIQKLGSCNSMCSERVPFINIQTSSCAWQSIKGMCYFPFTPAIMIYGEDPLPQEIKAVFATRHLAHIGGNGTTWKITSFLMCCLDAFISGFCFFFFFLLLLFVVVVLPGLRIDNFKIWEMSSLLNTGDISTGLKATKIWKAYNKLKRMVLVSPVSSLCIHRNKIFVRHSYLRR